MPFASWLSDGFEGLMKFMFLCCVLLWLGGVFLAKAAPQRAEQAKGQAVGALIRKLFGK